MHVLSSLEVGRLGAVRPPLLQRCASAAPDAGALGGMFAFERAFEASAAVRSAGVPRAPNSERQTFVHWLVRNEPRLLLD